MKAYDRLTARFAKMATIGEAQSVLSWDASAIMPLGGAPARGDQLAVLAGLEHGLLTAPETGDELAAAEADQPLHEWDMRNLRLMRHAYTRATALPAALVEAKARTNSRCEKIWREARAASDFAMVAPYLVEVVGLVRETAAALAPALQLRPYDALMDGYQQGINCAELDPIFQRYEHFLTHALPAAEERQARAPAALALDGAFAADRQETLCRHLSARAGLDYDHARLDRSAHPFCGGTPTDVRITTRYNEHDPATAIMGVLHETGHALYERGLPAVYARQPVGEAGGMAVHESQSLILEMQACRSDPYLSWLGPELCCTFGGSPERYAAGNLARLWRKVERGFIRVDADEVTYPAHIIVRYRMEQALLTGDLQVADLPGAFREGMHALLGVSPPDDARGCLQDIHWYSGGFGYFPSYTLGAMAAAQLMAAARVALPTLDQSLGQGDVQPLVDWLRKHVHAVASSLDFNDLLVSATGHVLDQSYFEDHLRRRYVG